jgi:hypothetical protein
MNWIKKLKNLIEKFKIGLKSSLKAQYTKFLDQNQAQNTSLDSVTAYKSKQQPKSNLKSRYESKTGFRGVNWIKNYQLVFPNTVKFLDQSQAQNTSLDSATAYKSKQQLKSNLKSRYESKTGYKVMDWIKKTLDPNQVQNTSLDSVTAYKSKLQPKSNLKSDSKS